MQWKNLINLQWLVTMSKYISLIIFVVLRAGAGQAPTDHPHFVFSKDGSRGSVNVVTAQSGQEAVFRCVVASLGTHKVAWFKYDTQQVLTLHTETIVGDPRISVERSGAQEWRLHVKNVTTADGGVYTCQINTQPPAHMMATLDVVVPPRFVDAGTSGDVTVREGDNATLTCLALGSPRPNITWQRSDGRLLRLREPVYVYQGTSLTLETVRRFDRGKLQCVASNGIAPSVSREILLKVRFAPRIHIPLSSVGAAMGGNVTLECKTAAYPAALAYWAGPDGAMVQASPRLRLSRLPLGHDEVLHRLSLAALRPGDFGRYACVASNAETPSKKRGNILLFKTNKISPSKGNLRGDVANDDGQQHQNRHGHGKDKTRADRKKNAKTQQYYNAASKESPWQASSGETRQVELRGSILHLFMALCAIFLT